MNEKENVEPKTRYALIREYYNQTHNKRITQEELADKFQLSRSTIIRIEKGDIAPSIEILQKYHNFFNVSYEYLLGESENKQSKNVKIGKELKLSDRAINAIRALKSNSHAKAVLNHILMSDNLEEFLSSLYLYWNISVYDLLDLPDLMTDKDISAKVKINKELPLLIEKDISPKYAIALKYNLEHRIHQFLLDNEFYIDPMDELLEGVPIEE